MSEKRHGFRSGWLIDSDGTPINEADILRSGTNPFGEQRVALRYPQLTLNAGVPLSNRRDYIITENGGSVESVNGKYRCRATTTTNSIGRLTSVQRCNYISGGVIEGGIGMFYPTLPTGDAEIEWGFASIDNDNKLVFVQRSDDLYLELVSAGTTELSVPQSEWNVDKMDGTGPSEHALDPTDGYVYQIPFVYYGFGDIVFEMMVSVNGVKRMIPIHRMSRPGDVSIAVPNLPLSVSVNSGTSGVQLDVYVAGRQISSSLPELSDDRSVAGVNLGVSIPTTNFVPLVSFRHKADWKQIVTRLTAVDILSNNDLIIQIRKDPTLTGATWDHIGDYTETERATEWDITATAISGGDVRWQRLVAGGQGNQLNAVNADVPDRIIGEEDVTTLCAKATDSTATANVNFIAKEQW